MEGPTANGVVWAGHLMAVFGPHEASPHHHAATQFAVGLDGEVEVRDHTGRRHRAPVVVVRAGAEHQFSCEHRSVVAWADALSTPSRSLLRRLEPSASGVVAAGPVEHGTMTRLHALANDFHASDAVACHSRLVAELAGIASPTPTEDPRVRRAAELLRAPTHAGTGSTPIPAVARSVGVSAARLRSMFRAQTGLPPSRYRIWWRMMEASRLLTEGWSVTDAAVTAGFADGAHFTRAFRALTGIPPGFVLAPGVEVEVLDDRFVQDIRAVP